MREELEPLLAEGWIITDLVAAPHAEGASALLLGSSGTKVLVVDRELALAQRTVDMINADGGTAAAHAADLTDEKQCKSTVEAAVDRQGRYAPTLTEIVKSGRFEGEVRAHFERFLREVIDSDVILADLHLNNVVFAYKPVIGDHFVIIDGIGFKTVIPLERMSPAINRIANRQKVAHFRRRVETLASEVADGASAASAEKPEHSRKLEPILSAPLLAALIAAAGLALALTTGEAALLP